MPERDGYIPGVPCWVDASEPDPKAAVGFYGGLFGWEFEDMMPPSSERKYFVARCETRGSSLFDSSGDLRGGDVAAVGSIPEAAPPRGMWNTYFWVESADEVASKVREADGGVVVEPFDLRDAARVAVFTDPEGAAFRVWEAKEHKGARLVNDPGSLNFNGLNTRDVEGARSFYGSVFGWQTLTMDGGAAGRDVHREQIRAGEQGSRQPGGPRRPVRIGEVGEGPALPLRPRRPRARLGTGPLADPDPR
jgi:predicted enzyme related to lactoylglutathione lyase